MHHILWIDYVNETYADDVVGERTKDLLEHYVAMGNGQILSITAVKEEAK